MSSKPTTSYSLINEQPIYWFHRLCFYILKCGAMPKHVAIIMDGNRRYARKKYIDKVEGHQRGFAKLTEALNWFLELEIYEVTVYAFSIENFKRNKEEVNALMDLARKTFKDLIYDWKRLQTHGICIRIIGNLTFLPNDLVTLIMISMLLTKDNKRGFLNIAFSYTGKEELVDTASYIIRGLRNGDLKDTDLNDKFIDQCLYTYQSPPPEIIIRTSGEIRLSDFLTWQSANSYIHFNDVLWPEFSPWNFISAIFYYQHFHSKMSKNSHDSANHSVKAENRKFADSVQRERLKILTEICRDKNHVDLNELMNFTPDELYDYYTLYMCA